MPFISNITRIGDNPDVIPDAVNWGNVSETYIVGPWAYTSGQIIGIGTTIGLMPQYVGNVQLWYLVNAADPVPGFNVNADPAANGMAAINNNAPFAVDPGEWVAFGVTNIGFGPFQNVAVNIVNTFDGNTVLDGFNAQII